MPFNPLNDHNQTTMLRLNYIAVLTIVCTTLLMGCNRSEPEDDTIDMRRELASIDAKASAPSFTRLDTPQGLTTLQDDVVSPTNTKNLAENSASNTKAAGNVDVLAQLQTEPVRQFASTKHDQKDLKQLQQFQDDFSQRSDNMEIMLQQQFIKLTASEYNLVEHKAKTENLQQALQQLNAMQLKSPQGRYIQQLWLQYWQNQLKNINHKQQATAPSAQQLGNNAGLNTYLQAQQQLYAWQAKQP